MVKRMIETPTHSQIGRELTCSSGVLGPSLSEASSSSRPKKNDLQGWLGKLYVKKKKNVVNNKRKVEAVANEQYRNGSRPFREKEVSSVRHKRVDDYGGNEEEAVVCNGSESFADSCSLTSVASSTGSSSPAEIGRASCRERV